jgi:glutathione peroxidase
MQSQMTKWWLTAVLFLAQLVFACAVGAATTAGNVNSLYDLSVNSLDGKPSNLSAYKGKLALIVNVASRCGYTPQYEGLESLYEKYKDQGFVILGFPSNDFGSQEPGTAEEIQEFCKMNYGVKFPLFEKNPVKGDAKQPIYKYLVEHAPKGKEGEVGWNFEKFLVTPEGQVIKRWKSAVKPDSSEIKEAVLQNLPKVSQK